MKGVPHKNPFSSRPGVKRLYGMLEKKDAEVEAIKKLNSELRDQNKKLKWRYKKVCADEHRRVMKVKATEKKFYEIRLAKMRTRMRWREAKHVKWRLKREKKKSKEKIGSTLRHLRGKSARYMDAVYAFVPLMNYIRMHKIEPLQFHVLVVACVMGQVKVSDFKIFGFDSIKVPRNKIIQMVDKGLMEKFVTAERQNLYLPSMKGRRLFLGFKSYYQKSIKDLTTDAEWQKGQSRWS